MLKLVDFTEFEVVVAPKLEVASSNRVGGFQQIVAEISVAGLDELGMLGFEVTRLGLCPDEAGKLGNRGFGLKPVDAANLGDDTRRVCLTDAWGGGEGIGDDLN